jgi:methylthioribose-1-phosphate isomerase
MKLNIPATMEWKDDKFYLLDQRIIPQEEKYMEIKTTEQLFEAIKTLAVRGAPAIGCSAGYGVVIALRECISEGAKDHIKCLKEKMEYLSTSRPTAVNLFWALRRMGNLIDENTDLKPDELEKLLIDEAISIQKEDIEMCKTIGKNAQELIPEKANIITHCNAGSLATGGYGTALGVIYASVEAGKNIKVYADETRPLLQGIRLTAWELMKAGVDVVVNCDNMSATLMKQGKIDCVVVGSDRIARNGDVANKIGTLGLSILARQFLVPFYVAVPSSTIDHDVASGDDIPIEQRDPEEITEKWYKNRMAPEKCEVYNPAFDVTPADLVDAIITEVGVHRYPYEGTLPVSEK